VDYCDVTITLLAIAAHFLVKIYLLCLLSRARHRHIITSQASRCY